MHQYMSSAIHRLTTWTQGLGLPQQRSLPRQRSRYRSRREGQETRSIQISASESPPDPLQRWRDSPPDQEAASIAAIVRVLDEPNHQLSHSGNKASESAFDARATKSRSIAGSNTSSLSSLISHKPDQSEQSTGSINRGPRTQVRGRRKRHIEKRGGEKPRIFACTFCCDSFRSKYDWARHEKSLHLNLETWTCAPRDGLVLSTSGEPQCAYCGFPNPTPQHLDQHSHTACARESRVFARKDHLVQHLRTFHRLNEIPPLDTWRQETPSFTCRCGFCNRRLGSWKARVDHLAEHFRKGFTMRDWQGEHEFSPSIAALAQDCIPPYLIGDESRPQQPFSASDAGTRDHYEHITTHTDGLSQSLEALAGASSPAPVEGERRNSSPPRTFTDILARHLAQIARAHMQQGITPTDEMFQSEARRVIYDSEDAWNQTIADNPRWMASFRRHHSENAGSGE
ncbi:hypothetical protein BJX76DRAFT_351371 [Aspergillus varians]